MLSYSVHCICAEKDKWSPSSYSELNILKGIHQFALLFSNLIMNIDCEFVCHPPPPLMVTAGLPSPRLNASWCFWTNGHQVCTCQRTAVFTGSLSWCLYHVFHHKKMNYAIELQEKATSLKTFAGNSLFFFFLQADFHWRPLTQSAHISCIHPTRRIHDFIWKVSKVNWG